MPLLLLLVSLFLAFGPRPVSASDRLALVIGNDAYADVPELDKAVADARAVSARLRDLGFEVVEGTDLGRRDMNRQISRFTARLEPGDTAFVFFAGHGVEIDGENYLLPTDILAPGTGESDFVKSESIALSGLLDRVRATGARTSIAIIDACRNNPFEPVAGRSIGRTRGLGRIVAPQGTFVIFSAGAGQLALDKLHDSDGAQNSVFTRALLPRLSQPGLELRAMMSDLRLEVRDLARTVHHSQIPAYYDELLGEFYFTPAAADAVPGAAVSGAVDRMRADLDLARTIGTRAAYDGFLDRYADRSGEYAYQVALQLRQGVTASPTPDTDPVKRHADRPDPAPPAQSERELVAASQAALNALNCNAGGADGVPGPRTRRAFRAYLAESGSALAPEDLGTRAALEELQAASGPVCKASPAPAPTQEARADSAPSLAGTWSFSASCAGFVKVTGTVRHAQAGPNFFTGHINDSLGQSATVETYLSGQTISGKAYFPGQTNVFSGRLAADGNSYTTTGTSTCAVQARRLR